MPTIRENYNAVDVRRPDDGSIWPDTVPELSAAEAVRAAKRLFRYACGETLVMPVVVTSGRRYSYIRRHTLYVNPERGWKNLVHELSHSFDQWVNGRSGHNKHHALLERRMAREVVRRGWLDGRLKDAPKPEPSADEKRVAAARTALDRIEARMEAWQRKSMRADNALTKLTRLHKAAQRKLDKLTDNQGRNEA